MNDLQSRRGHDTGDYVDLIVRKAWGDLGGISGSREPRPEEGRGPRFDPGRKEGEQ